MRESSQLVLRKCLENLKEIKKQKQILKEHYLRKINTLNESRDVLSPRLSQKIASEYEDECNDFLYDCSDELEQCCNLPELKNCLKRVCDRDGVVYDDCLEDEFDCAIDNAIDTLAWLIIPVKFKC